MLTVFYDGEPASWTRVFASGLKELRERLESEVAEQVSLKGIAAERYPVRARVEIATPGEWDGHVFTKTVQDGLLILTLQ